MRTLLISACTLALVALAGPRLAAGPVPFVLVNINAPGVGFNDATPAAPIGGNPGTTLGEQRLIAFQHAAAIWSARLDSDVPIRMRAQFVPLSPGVLGSAGPISVFRDFPNAPLASTWYHVALASKLAGEDLDPEGDDINVNFSSTFDFYLGIDNQSDGRPDLVVVLLHEFAHGLGFSQFSSLSTGNLFLGFPDVYNTKLFDNTQGLHWPQMTPEQRLASATSFGRVIWDGPRVTSGVPEVLSFGSPVVAVTEPVSLAGSFQFGTAAFGPPVGQPPVLAAAIAAVDPIEGLPGATSTDGCSPFTNAADVIGLVVLVERGACGFAVKARNATEAGAAAIVIYNNLANEAAGPPGMADDGVNGAFVTIPTVSLRRADGLAVVTATGVTMDIGVDLTVRAGADALDRARVYAPFPVAGGSSISHYDSIARRNLLMEPAINADLTHNLKAPDDLTFELLHDVGWTFPDADGDGSADDEDCQANSILTPTIVIGRIDTGVANTLFDGGCTSADLIAEVAAHARNRGAFVLGVTRLSFQWFRSGLITGREAITLIWAAAHFRTT